MAERKTSALKKRASNAKRGRPFEKGKPRPPGAGRKPGTPNKATREVRKFFRGVLESEEYRKRITTDLVAGNVHPSIEAMAHHYAFGKPKDRIEVEGSGVPQLVIYMPSNGHEADAEG